MDPADSHIVDTMSRMAEALSREQRTVLPVPRDVRRARSETVFLERVSRGLECGHRPTRLSRDDGGLGFRGRDKCEGDVSGLCDGRRRCSRGRTRHYTIRKYSLKLREVFAWLILLGIMQSTLAAPPRTNSPAKNMNGDLNETKPKWINPCETSSDESTSPDVEAEVKLNETIQHILLQTKGALSEAAAHKEDYLKKTFKVDFQDHISWMTTRYDWLPNKEQIPKELGEKLKSEHLPQSLLELNKALPIIYNYLQRFSAGLEQVTRDQNRTNGHFKHLFNSAEYKLKAVLCEIQIGMIDLNVTPPKDITRDIISDDIRYIDDDTFRNTRDWLIYRDYMNALEYVIQVFEQYKKLWELEHTKN